MVYIDVGMAFAETHDTLFMFRHLEWVITRKRAKILNIEKQ